MDFFLDENCVLNAFFKILFCKLSLFSMILKNLKLNFNIFSFSKSKDDLTICLHHNQLQLLPSCLGLLHTAGHCLPVHPRLPPSAPTSCICFSVPANSPTCRSPTILPSCTTFTSPSAVDPCEAAKFNSIDY